MEGHCDDAMHIDLLKVSNLQLTFYEFDEYARLIRAAEKIDLRTLVVVYWAAMPACAGAR